jgi:hypothetical protein
MPTAMRLLALANEKSSAKRLELLRGIADTFAVENEGPSASVQVLIDEIVTKLIDQIESGDRPAAS